MSHIDLESYRLEFVKSKSKSTRLDFYSETYQHKSDRVGTEKQKTQRQRNKEQRNRSGRKEEEEEEEEEEERKKNKGPDRAGRRRLRSERKTQMWKEEEKN